MIRGNVHQWRDWHDRSNTVCLGRPWRFSEAERAKSRHDLLLFAAESNRLVHFSKFIISGHESNPPLRQSID